MSASDRARRFLEIADDFRLGHLTTEQFHPLTREFDVAAQRNTEEAVEMLVHVDRDVVVAYRTWLETRSYTAVGAAVTAALRDGRRVVCVGCGATGRLAVQLERAWRRFWAGRHPSVAERVIAVPAGGDYAVVRSVEGFEDSPELAELQLQNLSLGPGDVVFALTEGGETPFVIGAAQTARKRGATAYFVYCNPDGDLASIPRSRAILDDPAIRKIRLVTGPMALSGSTRMQATTIQQLALLTILETAAAHLCDSPTPEHSRLVMELETAHEQLARPETLRGLAALVESEERAYRAGATANYVASQLALDALTDTTERAPTFGVPPFRKQGDETADDAWARVWIATGSSEDGWRRLLGRAPRCLDSLATRVADGRAIGAGELLRYRIGLDGGWRERIRRDAFVLAVLHENDAADPEELQALENVLETAHAAGARTGALLVGDPAYDVAAEKLVRLPRAKATALDVFGHASAKMALNILSTTLMARLGRVVGNCMACVTPTNGKLTDRAVRYLAHLGSLEYDAACHRLYAALEYLERRMQAGRAHPPVVPLALEATRVGSLPAAEARLRNRLAVEPAQAHSWR